MTFNATYFGSSGWFIELEDFKILIDPWLCGDLFFSPGPWLINGKLKIFRDNGPILWFRLASKDSLELGYLLSKYL